MTEILLVILIILLIFKFLKVIIEALPKKKILNLIISIGVNIILIFTLGQLFNSPIGSAIFFTVVFAFVFYQIYHSDDHLFLSFVLSYFIVYMIILSSLGYLAGQVILEKFTNMNFSHVILYLFVYSLFFALISTINKLKGNDKDGIWSFFAKFIGVKHQLKTYAIVFVVFEVLMKKDTGILLPGVFLLNCMILLRVSHSSNFKLKMEFIKAIEQITGKKLKHLYPTSIQLDLRETEENLLNTGENIDF